MAYAHGCGVESTILIVGTLAVHCPIELRHNHQLLRRCYSRLQRHGIGPCMQQIMQSIVGVECCWHIIAYVVLVGVGIEVSTHTCACIHKVVGYVDVHLLAKPIVNPGFKRCAYVMLGIIAVLPLLLAAAFAQILQVAVDICIAIVAVEICSARQRERAFLAKIMNPGIVDNELACLLIVCLIVATACYKLVVQSIARLCCKCGIECMILKLVWLISV